MTKCLACLHQAVFSHSHQAERPNIKYSHTIHLPWTGLKWYSKQPVVTFCAGHTHNMMRDHNISQLHMHFDQHEVSMSIAYKSITMLQVDGEMESNGISAQHCKHNHKTGAHFFLNTEITRMNRSGNQC